MSKSPIVAYLFLYSNFICYIGFFVEDHMRPYVGQSQEGCPR